MAVTGADIANHVRSVYDFNNHLVNLSEYRRISGRERLFNGLIQDIRGIISPTEAALGFDRGVQEVALMYYRRLEPTTP